MMMAAGYRAIWRSVALAIVGSALGGCVSSSLEEAAAGGDAAAVSAPATGADLSGTDFVDASAARTGVYPTFSSAPRGATSQMSDAEEAAFQTRIARGRSVRRGQGTKAADPQSQQRLEAVGRTHGQKARTMIEGGAPAGSVPPLPSSPDRGGADGS